MSYYQQHLFFCTNQRTTGEACCNTLGASEMLAYAKEKIKALGLDGPGKTRINKAGCLGRCAEGPVIVVYPEGIWYHYIDEQDIDEIIVSHLQNKKPVLRLQLAPLNSD